MFLLKYILRKNVKIAFLQLTRYKIIFHCIIYIFIIFYVCLKKVFFVFQTDC